MSKGFAVVTAVAMGLALPAYAQERGRDGELKLIFWQAPSILNPYIGGGDKDTNTASAVLEPLANYDSKGVLEPNLAQEIPTRENGGISKDMKTITWKLKEGVTWSDGTPFTSEDVKFTWEYCTTDGGGCARAERLNGVSEVNTPDEHTVEVVFEEPTFFPYVPFVSTQMPILQKAQFKDCMGAAMASCSEQNFAPIGTGPFKVDEFRTNDVAVFSMNENYREEGKPAFSRLVVKGGGDALSAARSVLQTGEYDFALNIQLAPEVIEELNGMGKGTVIVSLGSMVERLMLNQTDPNPELGEERGTAAHPHPFLSDKAVRQALSMAIDRQSIVDLGYGPTGIATCNILPAPSQYASTANDACLKQDIEGAKALLDEAGWVDSNGNGIRDKDGVELQILYQTSTNDVRQDTQALIKDSWEKIGAEVELRNIDPSVFFGSDAASSDTYQKFFADVQMLTNNFHGTDPEGYMAYWVCDQAPRPETQWQGNNFPRYCNEEYDALSRQFATTADMDERANIAKQMNDMLVQSYVMVPLVNRGIISAYSNTLEGVKANAWDGTVWNIGDWTRK